MRKNAVILVAEDDDGHCLLIKKGLARAGISNEILEFRDGQEILDFLFMRGGGRKRKEGGCYVLLLDIKMPKIDGIEVLRQIKHDGELRKIPTVILTTTDEPEMIERCHNLNCNLYVTKPARYDMFTHTIEKIGSFLSTINIPEIC